MLDSFIRHAHYLPFVLLLWLNIAYVVALFRTPHTDKTRREARFGTAMSAVALLVPVSLRILLVPRQGWYLSFLDVLTVYGMLIFAIFKFSDLVTGKATEPEYRHPFDILLLRRPVRQVEPLPQPPSSVRDQGLLPVLVVSLIMLGVVLFIMLPHIMQFSFILLFFLGVIIGLSLLVVGIVWRRSRKDPDYRTAWANYREVLRRGSASAAGPAPGSAYLVGVVAGALVLASSLGMGLYPCGWLDTLLQRSGCVRTLTFWPQTLTALAVAPDDTLLAYSTHDEVKLLRLAGGEHVHTFANPGFGRDLAFSPDSALLAVGGGRRDDHVRVWRVTDGTLVQMLATDDTPSILQFSPDGTLLATKSNEAAQLWRVADGTQLWTVPGFGRGVAFAPDGSLLAVSSEAGIDLWRVADLTLVRTPGEQAEQITFAPDGTVLVGVVGRSQIRVWRVQDGVLLHTLDWPQDRPDPYHFMSINSMAVSPDSTLIAAGGRDSTVRLWRVSDGALVATLDQTDVVESLAFTSSGELVVGLRSGTIRVWRVR